MKFRTSCFVRVEDTEKRKKLVEWLEGRMGYRYCVGCYNARSAIDSPLIPYVLVSTRAETGFVECFVRRPDEGIDCGNNIRLFKALAAMTDDRDDVNQWYVFAADYYFGEEDVYYHRGHVISGIDMIYVFEDWRSALYYCRKATADEIVEYFKK